MRVLVRDPADITRAHAVQDRFAFTPLEPAARSEGPRLAPIDGDVERMIGIINESIARNPPPAGEAPLLERFRAVGICGAACRWDDLSPALQARWRALAPEQKATGLQVPAAVGAVGSPS